MTSVQMCHFRFEWNKSKSRVKHKDILKVTGHGRNASSDDQSLREKLRYSFKVKRKLNCLMKFREIIVKRWLFHKIIKIGIYSFSFDARNVQRSIAKTLTLLESGSVLISHPETFTNRFQTWFKQESSSSSTDEIVQILDNLNGRQIRELFVNDGLKDACLVSEMEVSMTLAEGIGVGPSLSCFARIVGDHQGAPLPETHLQEWPSF